MPFEGGLFRVNFERKYDMTYGQKLRQRGFIKGFLAGYVTTYAADAALQADEESFRDYFLNKVPRTPFPELLQQSLQEGVKKGLLSLLREKKIAPEAIAEAIGWDVEDIKDLQS